MQWIHVYAYGLKIPNKTYIYISITLEQVRKSDKKMDGFT